jgi:sugar phosphate isomerase/epimerase
MRKEDSMADGLKAKKGFSSQWRSEEELERLLPAIASAGFAGIEPTFNTGAIPSPESYPMQAKRMAERCRHLGLQIPSMRGGGRFWETIPSPEAAQRALAREHAKRALECLAILGGKTLLVVPGRIHPDIPYEDHWNRAVEFAQEVGEIANRFGIVIGLENVEARFPLSVREWNQMLAEVNHPAVRMYLDVGNVFWLGLGFPEQWIFSLKERICQVHFKDASFGKSLCHLLEGEVNWKGVARALRSIGYQGWISVEPEWYPFAPERLPERLSKDLDAIFALAE